MVESNTKSKITLTEEELKLEGEVDFPNRIRNLNKNPKSPPGGIVMKTRKFSTSVTYKEKMNKRVQEDKRY